MRKKFKGIIFPSTIGLKIFSGFFMLLLLISIFIFTYYPNMEKKVLNAVMHDKYESTAQMIAFGVGVGMASDNYEVIVASLEWAKKDSNIVLIEVHDNNNENYGSYNPTNIKLTIPKFNQKDTIINIKEKPYHIVTVPIEYNNINHGRVSVYTSLEKHYNIISKNSKRSFYITLAIFIFVMVLSLFFIKSITKPLLQLQIAAQKIARGNYNIKVKVKSKDEIGILANSFNEMADQMKLFVQNLQKEVAVSKLAEVEISKSEEKFRKIAENISEGVCIIQSGQIHWANIIFNNIFGYSAEEISNLKSKSLLEPNEYQKLIHFFKNHFNNRKSYPFFDTIGIKKNKENIFISITAGKIIYENKPAVLMVIQDITLRVNNEQKLRELIATKDKFFSIIAHDLKSPFDSILGFSDILVEQVRVKQYNHIEKYAGIIQQSSNKAMNLLVNLMEWSQSQTGRMIFNPSYFEMVNLINDTVNLLNSVANQKSINIIKELPFSAPLYADKDMISTILRNLISNAIKFTKSGGQINIKLEEKTDKIIVSVSDNGIGIPKDNLEKLFKIDENISTVGTQKEAGTGLGLILCKEFVEKHSGTILVESKIDVGSTFSFTIPNQNISI